MHQKTDSISNMLNGLQFYDEQLRVLQFQNEAPSSLGNAFQGKGQGHDDYEGKSDRDKGKGKNHTLCVKTECRVKSVSFRGTSREPQGLWASHTAQRTEQARSTLFTLLFFSSPGLEPNPARLEASVHSSLDLKHFTAGEH